MKKDFLRLEIGQGNQEIEIIIFWKKLSFVVNLNIFLGFTLVQFFFSAQQQA